MPEDEYYQEVPEGELGVSVAEADIDGTFDEIVNNLSDIGTPELSPAEHGHEQHNAHEHPDNHGEHGHEHNHHHHESEHGHNHQAEVRNTAESPDCLGCESGGCEVHNHHAEADDGKAFRSEAVLHEERHVCAADCPHHNHAEEAKVHADEHVCTADCPHNHHNHEEDVYTKLIAAQTEHYEQQAAQQEAQAAADAEQARSLTTEMDAELIESNDLNVAHTETVEAIANSEADPDLAVSQPEIISEDSTATVETEAVDTDLVDATAQVPLQDAQPKSDTETIVSEPIVEVADREEVGTSLAAEDQEAGEEIVADTEPTETNPEPSSTGDEIGPVDVVERSTPNPASAEHQTEIVESEDMVQQTETVQLTDETFLEEVNQLNLGLETDSLVADLHELETEISEVENRTARELVSEALNTNPIADLLEGLDAIEISSQAEQMDEAKLVQLNRNAAELIVLINQPEFKANQKLDEAIARRMELLLHEFGIDKSRKEVKQLLSQLSADQLIELIKFLSRLRHDEYRQEFIKVSQSFRLQLSKPKKTLAEALGIYALARYRTSAAA